MNKVVDSFFKNHQTKLDDFISNFAQNGEQFGEASRNTIKLFNLNEKPQRSHIPNAFFPCAYISIFS